MAYKRKTKDVAYIYYTSLQSSGDKCFNQYPLTPEDCERLIKILIETDKDRVGDRFLLERSFYIKYTTIKTDVHVYSVFHALRHIINEL